MYSNSFLMTSTCFCYRRFFTLILNFLSNKAYYVYLKIGSLSQTFLYRNHSLSPLPIYLPMWTFKIFLQVRELAEKEPEDGVFRMLRSDVTRFLTTILIGTTYFSLLFNCIIFGAVLFMFQITWVMFQITWASFC